jgi:hypothetical protein
MSVEKYENHSPFVSTGSIGSHAHSSNKQGLPAEHSTPDKEPLTIKQLLTNIVPFGVSSEEALKRLENAGIGKEFGEKLNEVRGYLRENKHLLTMIGDCGGWKKVVAEKVSNTDPEKQKDLKKLEKFRNDLIGKFTELSLVALDVKLLEILDVGTQDPKSDKDITGVGKNYYVEAKFITVCDPLSSFLFEEAVFQIEENREKVKEFLPKVMIDTEFYTQHWVRHHRLSPENQAYVDLCLLNLKVCLQKNRKGIPPEMEGLVGAVQKLLGGSTGVLEHIEKIAEELEKVSGNDQDSLLERTRVRGNLIMKMEELREANEKIVARIHSLEMKLNGGAGFSSIEENIKKEIQNLRREQEQLEVTEAIYAGAFSCLEGDTYLTAEAFYDVLPKQTFLTSMKSMDEEHAREILSGNRETGWSAEKALKFNNQGKALGLGCVENLLMLYLHLGGADENRDEKAFAMEMIDTSKYLSRILGSFQKIWDEMKRRDVPKSEESEKEREVLQKTLIDLRKQVNELESLKRMYLPPSSLPYHLENALLRWMGKEGVQLKGHNEGAIKKIGSVIETIGKKGFKAIAEAKKNPNQNWKSAAANFMKHVGNGLEEGEGAKLSKDGLEGVWKEIRSILGSVESNADNVYATSWDDDREALLLSTRYKMEHILRTYTNLKDKDSFPEDLEKDIKRVLGYSDRSNLDLITITEVVMERNRVVQEYTEEKCQKLLNDVIGLVATALKNFEENQDATERVKYGIESLHDFLGDKKSPMETI